MMSVSMSIATKAPLILSITLLMDKPAKGVVGVIGSIETDLKYLIS